MNPCHKCGADYDLREGCEPTTFCDSCAQTILDEMIESMKQIAGMAETGHESVNEIVGARVGSGGRPSIRGAFLSIANLARAILKKAGEA